jgi:hypothetical protein
LPRACSQIADPIPSGNETEESDDVIEKDTRQVTNLGIFGEVKQVQESTDGPRKISARQNFIDSIELGMTMTLQINQETITISKIDTRGGEERRGGVNEMFVKEISCREIHEDMIL